MKDLFTELLPKSSLLQWLIVGLIAIGAFINGSDNNKNDNYVTRQELAMVVEKLDRQLQASTNNRREDFKIVFIKIDALAQEVGNLGKEVGRIQGAIEGK